MIEQLTEQRKRLIDVAFPFQKDVDLIIAELTRSPSVAYRTAEDVPFIRKFFVHDKAVTEGEGIGEGQVKHWISTTTVDRVGDVMEPKGALLQQYRKNPVVFWGHDYKDPENIVGNNLWIRTDEKGLFALTQFDLEANKAASIYRLYQKKLLRGWSVGFIPIKGKRVEREGATKPKPGEIVIDLNPPAPGQARYIHDKWLLLEYSAVSIPANPDALTEQVAKEYDIPTELQKELGIHVEKLIGDYGPGRKIFDMTMGGAASDEEQEKTGSQAEAETAAAKGTPPPTGDAGCPDCNGGDGDAGDDVSQADYDAGEPVADDLVIKPYPGNHACRLKEPGRFQEGSFRTMSRDHEGKPYKVIMGKLKGESAMTEQAYRYPTSSWSTSEARSHCKGHGGILFEPAASESGVDADSIAHRVAGLIEKHLVDANVKIGRVLSEKNRKTIADAVEALDAVTSAMKSAAKAATTAVAALKDLLAATQTMPPDAETEKDVEGETGLDIEGGLLPDADVILAVELEGEDADDEVVELTDHGPEDEDVPEVVIEA